MKLLKKIDLLIFFPIIVIFSLGELTLFSIDVNYFKSQLIFFVAGFLIYLFLTSFDSEVFKKFAFLGYIISILLLVLTLFIGRIARGSSRWIYLGNLGIQPSEIVKPFLIIFFAHLGTKPLDSLKKLFIYLFVLLLPSFLIFRQPDLGSSLMVALAGVTIALFSGVKFFYLILILIGGGIALPLLWRFLKDYQRIRITSFLNPFADPLGAGYHLIQSMIAVGSGGFWGRGLGEGTQGQLKFLPEKHTDFVFASLAEQLGFLGSAILLIAYFLFLLRIFFILKKTKNKFEFLTSVGIFTVFFFQFFVNVGMNLVLLPITGVTLPFVSAGGSSLLSSFISLAIIQCINIRLNDKRAFEIK